MPDQALGGLGPACLAIHGLGGGPYELRPLIEAIRATGRRVESLTLPGHEARQPIMPASTWPEWAAAVDFACDDLTLDDVPPSIVGFSTGATLALHAASRRRVDRLVLLAPFLAIRHSRLLPFPPSLVLRALARFRPDLPRRPPAVREGAARAELIALDRFRTFSLPSALSALELIGLVEDRLDQVKTPTLILQGRLDTVVEPARAAWLHTRLGSDLSRFVEFHQSDHMLAWDRNSDDVARETLSFLGLSSNPSDRSQGRGTESA